MFISPKFKLLFIHIPKTAGYSIEEMIQVQDPNAFETKYTHDSVVNNWKTIEKYKEYYKFTVVRNSWQLCASCYRFECKGVRWKANNKTFKEWFIWKVNNKEPNHHPFPNQLDYITKDGKIIVDKIIRYEELEKGLRELCKEVGLEFKLNKTAHYYGDYDWRNFYSDIKDINLIETQCRNDIIYFGWNFE